MLKIDWKKTVPDLQLFIFPMFNTSGSPITVTLVLQDIWDKASVSLAQGLFLLFFSPAVRTCFVSDLQRGLKIQEAKFNLDGTAEVNKVFMYWSHSSLLTSLPSLEFQPVSFQQSLTLGLFAFPILSLS